MQAHRCKNSKRYTALHSCELQLVQKPAGTSEREKSLVRVTISQSTSANAPLAQRLIQAHSHYASNDQKQQAKGSDAEAGSDQLRPEATSLLGSPAQSPREGAFWSQRTRVSTRLADALGLKDAQEARLVSRLILMGALANIAFVFGRNAGPALYVNHLGSRRLARAMFLSALSVFAVTPRFSTYARPRRAVRVYAACSAGAVLLACLGYAGLAPEQAVVT